MTRFILTLPCILTFTLSIKLYGQGRVDSDPILYNIWRTVQKVDWDDNLQKKVQTDSSTLGMGFKVCFYKSDTLYKVSELTKMPSGTQLTSYYFNKGKPVYISVDRNDFKLTGSIQDINKAIASFNKEPDTLSNQKPIYIEQYNASYYFYKDRVRFAAVVTYSNKGQVEKVRQDDKNDVMLGMKLYKHTETFKLNNK